ncbi:hypothetical protein DPMN_097220, partial [Dreissena polymorpha]
VTFALLTLWRPHLFPIFMKFGQKIGLNDILDDVARIPLPIRFLYPEQDDRNHRHQPLTANLRRFDIPRHL